MGTLEGILAEFRQDRTGEMLVAAAILFAVTRALAAPNRERVRSSLILLGLHLMLVPVAGAFRMNGSTLYTETRLAALVMATFAFIGLTATFLFAVALPRLRVAVPRIVQDVVVAGSSLIAFFMLASRAGINLSGLIATSAVLTAVIGLAFQDTLGNVVGGLAIQLDESVSLGDWIKVGDVVGRVTEIRWRYTAVETRNWETVILPNSLLSKGQVTVLGRRTGQPIQWRRWVYFNVDFRYRPSEVINAVLEALSDARIDRVALDPPLNCILMDLGESYAHYAVRYWLTDLAVDDPTDGVIRMRIHAALRRAGIPLSIPAQAVFVTEDSTERRETKTHAELDRRQNAIARVDLFAGLSEEERAHLVKHLTYTPFSQGETMTLQGTEGHFLYMIIKGGASVRINADGEATRELAKLGPGDFFGEMSLLTGEKRFASVVALSPMECYRLDKSAFEGLIAKRPELAEHMADVLARRREELTHARADLDHETATARLHATRNDLLGKIRSFFSLDETK